MPYVCFYTSRRTHLRLSDVNKEKKKLIKIDFSCHKQKQPSVYCACKRKTAVRYIFRTPFCKYYNILIYATSYNFWLAAIVTVSLT